MTTENKNKKDVSQKLDISGDRKTFQIPEEIEKHMKLWRRGLASMPKSYIEWNRDVAKQILESQDNITIHNTWMASDGWMDGMQVLHAVIETRGGKLLKIKYHDGNRGFMQKCDGGGWGLLSERDL